MLTENLNGVCSYSFDGAAGDRVTLRMDAGAAGLDPVLVLLNPGGEEEAYDDDGGGNGNSLIEDHHLLQSGRYHPLGTAEPVQADVRVIAATNIDLEEAVRQRRFREDLFYRLQVLPVRLPSLGERNEDVVELARSFCAEASRRHGLRKLALSPGVQRAVEAAEWPGNVRQLAHAIEAAVIRAAAEETPMLERQHIFPSTETGVNVTEAARRLDLARSHVYNLIRAFGFQRSRPQSEIAES